MIPLSSAGVAVLLLAMAITALVLAAVGGLFSIRARGSRAGILAALGVAALAGMALVLWAHPWEAIRGDVLWPMLVYVGATAAGLGMAAGLVFALVAAR